MADEQETIALAPELETPAIETPEAEAPEVEKPETVELPQPEEVEEPQETEAPEIEYVSVERNGKTYQVPKELEGEFMMQADYTRKRQADAEKAKATEAELASKMAATEAELDARADLRAVNKALEEYAKLTPEDWAAHVRTNPQATQEAQLRWQMLKDQKAELEDKLSKAQSERAEQSQQSLAKRIQETLEYGKTNSTGWKPDAIPALVEFAESMGIPEDAIKANWSPTFADLLHLAKTGKQLLSKPAPTPKAPTPAPAPLERVTGKSTPAAAKSLKDIASGDDMEAYAKARQAGRVR